MKQKIRYTKIENDFLEKALEMKLTISHMKVLFAFVRKLNGFHKESDRVSISQLMELTKLSNRAIIDAENDLQSMNILSQVEKGISRVRPTKWKLNKDTTLWRPVNRSSPVNFYSSTYELFTSGSVNTSSHTKENKRKQNGNIKKISKEKMDALRDELRKKYPWFNK